MKMISFFLLMVSGQVAWSQSQTPDQLIDAWHEAAAKAQFNTYFGLMAESSIFIGTAPGERWNKTEFMAFSKPYFDKGKAWDFKSKERKWAFSDDGNTAWFDEVLDTWMRDCRGAGVIMKINGEWKIMFYDLHVLIENEKIKPFLELRDKKE